MQWNAESCRVPEEPKKKQTSLQCLMLKHHSEVLVLMRDAAFFRSRLKLKHHSEVLVLMRIAYNATLNSRA